MFWLPCFNYHIAQPVLPKSKLLDRCGTLQAYGCVQVSKRAPRSLGAHGGFLEGDS